MNRQVYKVLLVEDEENDYILTKNLLGKIKSSKYDLQWVSRYEDALEKMKQNQHDIYLVDYHLGKKDGLTLVREAIDQGVTTPIILLTGQGGFETDVEAMKAGATDYLVKGQIDAPLLERSIRYAIQRKQDELALRDITKKKMEEHTTQLGNILEDSLNEIYIFDAESLHFIQVNRGARKNLGYSLEELRSLTPLDLKPEFTLKTFKELVEPLRSGEKEKIRFETVHQRKNGTVYPVEVHLQLSSYEAAPAFVALIQDVTERKQRDSEMEAIVQVGQALRGAKTRSDIIRIILDQLVGLLDTEGAAFTSYDQISEENIVELGSGIWAEIIDVPLAPNKGITAHVIKTRETYINNQAKTHPDPRDSHPELTQKTNAVACIPLIAQEKVIGTMWIGRKATIGNEEIRLMRAIGNIAASAINRSTLHEKTQQSLRRLSALHTIDNSISSSLDLHITLNILTTQVISVLQVDASAIFMLDDDSKILSFAAGQGFRTHKQLHKAQVGLGESFAGRAAMEQRLVQLSDLSKSDMSQNFTNFFSKEKFVSYIGAPLIAKGRVLGVLEIYHRTPLNSEPEWLSFFETLAGQAAIAIDNSILYTDLQKAISDISIAYDSTLEGWIRALAFKDEETEAHSQRVTTMTLQLAKIMGIDDDELVHVGRGALLHDIGKMGVPENILLKAGKLTNEERKIIEEHPVYAYEWLSPIEYLRPALDIPYCHHEKWDGTGYPRGLKGEEIPLPARIFAIVDIWDALSSDRPYRKAWPNEKVMNFIKEETGKHLEPAVVESFLKLI